MVQFPQLDHDVVEWNSTRRRLERHLIGHSGTRVGGNLVQLGTFMRIHLPLM